jgi:hypothetical protein
LVLEYGLTEYYGTGGMNGSYVRYEVRDWLTNQSILRIVYSGGWVGNGASYVGISSWGVVFSNGTPTGQSIDPLWMDTAGWSEGMVFLPPGNPHSRLYDLTVGESVVPEGEYTCWVFDTTWYNRGLPFHKRLCYESALGFLVEDSEDGFTTIQSSGSNISVAYEFTMLLCDINIQTVLPLGAGERIPTPYLLALTLWFMLSVAVVAVPIAIRIRSKS